MPNLFKITTGCIVALLAPASALHAHINELIPPQTTAGGPAFILRVLGTDLEPSEILLWNGTPLPTTWINSGEMRVPITAQMIGTAGAAAVTLAGFNSLPFTINPPMAITTASPLPGGNVGVAYSQTLQRTGGTATFRWSITGGALPTGLSLDQAAGVLSGTPTANGTFTFTARVTDSATTFTEKIFSIAIGSGGGGAGPVITTASPLDRGIVGMRYAQTLQATGGSTPYRWSITAGTLPGGLSLDGTTGTIAGTPAIAGTSNFTAMVTDSAGGTATKVFELTIVLVRGRLIVPQIADGNFWRTTIRVLNNSSTETVSIQIRFWSSQGSRLSFPIVDEGIASALNKVLPPGGSVVYRTEGTAIPETSGWIEILSTNTSGTLPPVTGFAVFRQRIAGRPDYESTALAVASDSVEVLFPFDNTEAYVTSIAVVNPTLDTAVIAVRFRSGDGVALLDDTITLPPLGHAAFETTRRFGASLNRNGTLIFSATTGRIAPIGLHFNPTGPFTALPHQAIR